MHFATVLLPNCMAVCLLVITLEFFQEINGFPTPINPHIKRRERGFKYVPLNSMTLSTRKQPAKNSAGVTSEEQQTPKEDNEGRNKRPWWESLPSNKNQKNKVILDEYDKLKSSIPKWPWMTALKEGSGNSNPITRKKTNRDKVRVVMTTAVPKLQMTETTVKPLIIMSPDMSDMEENIMPLTTVTSEDDKMSEMTIMKEMPEMTMVKKMSQMMKEVPEMTIMEKMSEMAIMKEMSEMTSTIKKPDEMSTAKSENIPDWLEAYNNRAETTKKPIDWFASWSPSTTTDNPFKYKINSGKETSFPVIEVNGPPIKLPSFSVSSNFKVFSENDKENKMQMYSDIEQRTGSSSDGILDEENFDLNFFQQRQVEDNHDEKYTLLAHEPMLGDLETTTTQRPFVTQSLSPIENREALSQLVSLYEQAPSAVAHKGETDKTQMKNMEMDKTKDMVGEDYKYDEMMIEESQEDVQMYKFDHPISNGIPPSITLQLAASKSKMPSKTTTMASTTTSSSTSPSFGINGMNFGIKQISSQNNNMKAEQKIGGMDETSQQKQIKSTLKKLLEGNQEMMRSVQNRLTQQTRLLQTLMDLL